MQTLAFVVRADVTNFEHCTCNIACAVLHTDSVNAGNMLGLTIQVFLPSSSPF